jgi:chromosome transmission fidelity protein 1
MQKDYHHPYAPYDVQREFMSMVYKCLEEGKVGVFESPTGTVSRLFFVMFLERDFGRGARQKIEPM